MGAFIRMRALIGIGALIDENTFEGGALIRKGGGGLIGRRALNQIITPNIFGESVAPNEAGN